MKKIGRIKYTSKGAYDSSKTYTLMNVVLYEGSLWECIKETTGNFPPDHLKEEDGSNAKNEYWELFLPGALGDDYIKKTDIAKPPTAAEPGKAGIVMPDGKTIHVDEDGLLTGTPVDFVGSWKELQEGLKSGEVEEGMIGYIEGSEGGVEDPDHPNNFLFDIDNFLSTVSSNAVQNRIVTAALNKLEQLENETRALRASLESFGLSKICPVDVTDVTEDNGLVLGAVEKNASVEGTIANSIQKIQTEFSRVGEFIRAYPSAEFTVQAEITQDICEINLPPGKWLLIGSTLSSGQQYLDNAEISSGSMAHKGASGGHQSNTCFGISTGNRKVTLRLYPFEALTISADPNYTYILAIRIK